MFERRPAPRRDQRSPQLRSISAVGGSRLMALLFILMSASAPAGAQPAPDYRLLEFDRSAVKWGPPAFGEGAVIRYAVIEDAHETPEARNCRSMASLGPLLAQARLDRAEFDAALADAFDAWSAAAQLEFRQTDVASADILIGADGAPRGAAFADVQPTPGFEPIRGIDRALICLDPRHGWQVSAESARPRDLRYALMHEIGHAIGLNHPGPKGQLMSFDYDDQPAGLRDGDIEGARRLYGARAPGVVAQAPTPASGPATAARPTGGFDGAPSGTRP